MIWPSQSSYSFQERTFEDILLNICLGVEDDKDGFWYFFQLLRKLKAIGLIQFKESSGIIKWVHGLSLMVERNYRLLSIFNFWKFFLNASLDYRFILSEYGWYNVK